jgi:hypothetical protein
VSQMSVPTLHGRALCQSLAISWALEVFRRLRP